jgi:hypothetical protein
MKRYDVSFKFLNALFNAFGTAEFGVHNAIGVYISNCGRNKDYVRADKVIRPQLSKAIKYFPNTIENTALGRYAFTHQPDRNELKNEFAVWKTKHGRI